MNLNASYKNVSYDGRVTVPTQIAKVFDKTKPIYIIKASEGKTLTLTQKTNKRNATQVVNAIMPYNNGTVQLSLNPYFKNIEHAVVFNSGTKQSAVTIHCF